MCLFPSIINFVNNVHLLSKLRSRNQESNATQLSESNQIEIASRKLSNIEGRINNLNDTFNLQKIEVPSSALIDLSAPDYSIDDLKQKISSVRTQLLDLACIITAQMVKHMLGIIPNKSDEYANDEKESSELMVSVKILDNFLTFLENQANRLKKPKSLSEKRAKLNIHPFFQKVSINHATHSYIFTLNIRLAVLNEKFSDLEKKLIPYEELRTASICLDRVSHDIDPRAYQVLEEISKTHHQITEAPEEIKKSQTKNLENAIASFGF